MVHMSSTQTLQWLLQHMSTMCLTIVYLPLALPKALNKVAAGKANSVCEILLSSHESTSIFQYVQCIAQGASRKSLRSLRDMLRFTKLSIQQASWQQGRTAVALRPKDLDMDQAVRIGVQHVKEVLEEDQLGGILSSDGTLFAPMRPKTPVKQ